MCYFKDGVTQIANQRSKRTVAEISENGHIKLKLST